ncbi:hypothetical protein WJU24_05725 [Bacillus subtilis]
MVKIQELYDVIFHTAFEGFRVRLKNKQQNRLETDDIRNEPLPNIIKKMNEIRENLF